MFSIRSLAKLFSQESAWVARNEIYLLISLQYFYEHKIYAI